MVAQAALKRKTAECQRTSPDNCSTRIADFLDDDTIEWTRVLTQWLIADGITAPVQVRQAFAGPW